MTGLSNTQLHFVDTTEKAGQVLTWLGERRPDQVLGFDTETHGLDIYAPRAKLRMVQIGDGEQGFAIPWEQWGGVAIEVLNKWKGRLTAHNLAFDYKVMRQLANYELPWHRFDDTMIMAQIATPGGMVGLKAQTDKHVDPRASQGAVILKEAFKNNGWDWSNIPLNFEPYWVYSALDPILAVKLHDHYRYIPETYSQVYDLEFAVRRVCANMEHQGMRIDLDYVKEQHEIFNKKIAESNAYIEETYNLQHSSTPQLVEFFTNIGAKFSEFTPKGAPSVNALQLDKFAIDENPAVSQPASLILSARKAEKLNSAYFKNFLTMHDNEILHPNIKTMGARTGRMSVTDPALQTLPSGDKLIRNAFIRRNEGEVLISCDYSQMELRLLAHYSKDPSLIEAFQRADSTPGGDFFNEAGKSVFNNEDFDRNTPEFKGPGKAIKTLFYGLIYGASVAKLAEQSKIPLKEMQGVYDNLIKAFPGISSFMKETIALGELREKEEGEGYVLLDSGRRLQADRGKMYTLTNYLLQGSGAEMTKLSLLRLDAAGLGPMIQMAVHDEIIFSVPEEEVDYWMPIIEECMSFVDDEYLVRIPAQPEVYGFRWGDGYGEVA